MAQDTPRIFVHVGAGSISSAKLSWPLPQTQDDQARRRKGTSEQESGQKTILPGPDSRRLEWYEQGVSLT